MAKSKASASDLVAKLRGADTAEVVILLSELRDAVGSDLSDMRQFTVSDYRDEYLAHDARTGSPSSKPRGVRVRREALLDFLAGNEVPASKAPEPVKTEAKPEPVKPADKK